MKAENLRGLSRHSILICLRLGYYYCISTGARIVTHADTKCSSSGQCKQTKRGDLLSYNGILPLFYSTSVIDIHYDLQCRQF